MRDHLHDKFKLCAFHDVNTKCVTAAFISDDSDESGLIDTRAQLDNLVASVMYYAHDVFQVEVCAACFSPHDENHLGM